MDLIIATVVGILMASSIYLLLQRSLGQAIIGLALLSNAVNLFIFAAAGLSDGTPPLIPAGGRLMPAFAADPLPQAVILTAIVIAFGVLAFFITLCYRVYRITGTDDLAALTGSDRNDGGHVHDDEPHGPRDEEAA